MEKSLFLYILLSIFCYRSSGQSSHYALTQHAKGASPNAVSYIVRPIDQSAENTFQGLPAKKDYRIGCLDLQKEQTAYENYLAKKDLDEQESRLLKEQDTTRLSRKPTKHRIFFLVYFEKDKKIIVPDLNCNYDFRDEKVFEFKAIGQSGKEFVPASVEIGIQYEYVENKNIIPRNLPVIIEPVEKRYIYKDYPDGRFHVSVKQFEYVKGTITLDDTLYYYTACSGGNQKGVFKNFNMHFSASPFPDTVRFGFDQIMGIKDSIVINSKSYAPHFSVFGDTFFLEPYKKINVTPVNLMDEFSRKITTDDQNIDLGKIRGSEMTVIDFWGTWCSPCVKDLPEMKKMHERFKDLGVYFIGIAVDYDQEKVKKMIKSKSLVYPIIFENLGFGSDFIFKKLEINTFPTYLILDKTGNIVYSTHSITDLETQLNKK